MHFKHLYTVQQQMLRSHCEKISLQNRNLKTKKNAAGKNAAGKCCKDVTTEHR